MSTLRRGLLGSAVVALMLLLVACGGPQAQKAKAKHKAPPVAPFKMCTVAIEITGLNAVQALGTVHLQFQGGGAYGGPQNYTSISPSGGSAEGICDVTGNPTTVTVTETPNTLAKAFTGWTVSGNSGAYNDTNFPQETLIFTLTGNTTVLANYSH